MDQEEPVWLSYTSPDTLRRRRHRPVLISALTVALLAAAGTWAARPHAAEPLTVPVAGATALPTSSAPVAATTSAAPIPAVTVTSVVTVTVSPMPSVTPQPKPMPAKSALAPTSDEAASSDSADVPDNGDMGNPAGQAISAVPIDRAPAAPVASPNCPTMKQIGGTMAVVARAPYPEESFGKIITVEVKYNNPRRYPLYLNGTISYTDQYGDSPLFGWKNGEQDVEPRDVKLRPGPGSFRLRMIDLSEGAKTANLKWTGWQLAPGPGVVYFSDDPGACAATSRGWVD